MDNRNLVPAELNKYLKIQLILDRNWNAALDILGKGTQFAGMVLNTAGHAEINAWGDLHATLLLIDSKGMTDL